VRPDPDGASDVSKLTDFGCLSQSDKVSDWIADRLAEGLTTICACGVFRLGDVTGLALCNHSLTFVFVDGSMRRHYKSKKASYSPIKQLLLST
jgi:hypothetical protein